MYKITPRLARLIRYYDIANLEHGKKEDKSGDVYEEYCKEILSDNELLQKYKYGSINLSDTDEYIFTSIFNKYILIHQISDINKIHKIEATREIMPRITGGNPKTDVIVDLTTDNGLASLPISIKQTKATKVAMAEFDVDTIVKEVNITDHILIELLEKHQLDASAKNFSKPEKENLRKHLIPYAKRLVRWVISGTPEPINDLRFPDLLLKFSLNQNNEIENINCFTIDEYVDYLIYDKNHNPRNGGFGTGLSWTYATGSKGKKIQFKG